MKPACAPHPPAPTSNRRSTFDVTARMLAHEIRNLLTPMRVRAQMAMEHPRPADAHVAALDYAIATADRIAAVTDAILFCGGESASATAIPAGPLLCGLRDSLPACSGAPPRVHIEIEEDLTVTTDPTALRHILLNLLANANRASCMSQGGVRVSAERSTWNTSRGVATGVRFTITDDGPGMDRTTLRRLNQAGGTHSANRGKHADRRPSDAKADAGVGLHVVQRLVKQIQGDVHASNPASGGARLTLLIPDLPIDAKPHRSHAA